ncbi:hypothetical protein [Formosa sp. PL04]|uniref:hypothetical protein n=1 Tax=Formosa sp. PL04 TaxID=3081755 RepID=UPI002981E1FB|nr:hypothetical protein [Formosa sp. PL04]MDW5290601.1 hypothetical protein [Formosa sp. PL04]
MNETLSTKEQNNSNQGHTTLIVNQESNGIGMAGFVLAIISLFLGWIPVFGWIIWFVGLILSFVGVFKRPKGFAIAGLVISLIGFIFLIFIFAGLALLGGAASLAN